MLSSYLDKSFNKLPQKMLLPLCVSFEKSKPCGIYLGIMQVYVYVERGVPI